MLQGHQQLPELPGNNEKKLRKSLHDYKRLKGDLKVKKIIILGRTSQVINLTPRLKNYGI